MAKKEAYSNQIKISQHSIFKVLKLEAGAVQTTGVAV